MPTLSLLAAAALSCTAIDGDTLRCQQGGGQQGGGAPERVRLIGIDAPEMPGHCRAGRVCAPGDPRASKAALARLIRGRALRIERRGRDWHGRTLALVWAGHTNLSCAMIQRGHAIYVERWDSGGRVRLCL